MEWIKEAPKIEGWYFWRRAKNIKDAWRWNAIFVMLWRDGDEPLFYEGGAHIVPPKGGWWSKINTANSIKQSGGDGKAPKCICAPYYGEQGIHARRCPLWTP